MPRPPVIDHDDSDTPQKLEPTVVDEVKQLAAEIRALWIEEWKIHKTKVTGRRMDNYSSSVMWDGGTDSMGRKHEPKWEKIAQHLLNKKLDPYTMVKAVFTNTHLTPAPTIMLSETALKKYVLYQASNTTDFDLSYSIQLNTFNIALEAKLAATNGNETEAAKMVLTDQYVELSALFRYCAAQRLSLEPIAAFWEPAAVKQYVAAAPSYNQHWKSFIPQKLKQSVIE